VFGIGGSELVIIVLVAVLVFGPTTIPEIARNLSRFYQEWHKFRRQLDNTVSELRQEISLELDDAAPAKPIPPAVHHTQPIEAPEASPLPVAPHDDYLTAGVLPYEPEPTSTDPPVCAPSEDYLREENPNDS